MTIKIGVENKGETGLGSDNVHYDYCASLGHMFDYLADDMSYRDIGTQLLASLPNPSAPSPSQQPNPSHLSPAPSDAPQANLTPSMSTLRADEK